MKLRFTAHAEKQLIERKIVKKLVNETVCNPEQVIPQGQDVLIYQKIYKEVGKEYLLRVAIKLSGDTYVVLTAYKTSKIKKYGGDK
ncbi:hypothetical protein MTHERMOG20_15840 [Moorella thermoacetica]|nr:DUF4258 domain-containing protein [Moorella thermoacetica]AKX95181.1 hypothetical protein MOTHE_c24020 [Moorella thermoacetica]AKX97806.1 hypothetical protein MOTHA_c24740 [Moorella thermoacetica]OIQ12266.1 hypothetical protein MOOTH_09030 [Moorella thermoacetica]OIQ55243.1 hypothetical protein MOTE_24100 [Moorella thermoacetica]OIQ56637.1 hypothetical protein MOCA_12140 [Moorella thermoacetica]